MPSLYRDMLAVQQQVPLDATLWYVAPYSPRELLYFLYPRVLRWGSPNVADLEKIRQAHPADWVISDHSDSPAEDTVTLWPPLDLSRLRQDSK